MKVKVEIDMDNIAGPFKKEGVSDIKWEELCENQDFLKALVEDMIMCWESLSEDGVSAPIREIYSEFLDYFE